jgi:hypothetical protein
LLYRYDMNVPKAVAAAFPTIKIEESKFSSHQSTSKKPKEFYKNKKIIVLTYMAGNYWQNRGNRSNFFMSFASKEGLEPLNPETWYSTSVNQILAYKVRKKGGSSLFRLKSTLIFATPAFEEKSAGVSVKECA